MSKTLRANIELGINIVIAIAIVAVAAAVVKRYVFSANPESPLRIAKGDRLEVPNVNWEQNEKTLVFFLKIVVIANPAHRSIGSCLQTLRNET